MSGAPAVKPASAVPGAGSGALPGGDEEIETDQAGMMPFARDLEIEIFVAAGEEVRARMPWAARLCTVGGSVHGGALMTLADSAGALCAYLNRPDGAVGTTTVSSSTVFLRAGRSGPFEAVARPAKVGGRVAFVDVEITDSEGRPIARTSQVQMVM